MRRCILIAVLLIVSCAPARAEETLAHALAQHCFRCHGEKKIEGEVNLANAISAKLHGLASDLELVDKLLDALENGDMPPEDEKQPTPAERAS